MKSITALELKKKLDAGEVFLIDVREPEEYRDMYIEGACLIPLGEITKHKIPTTSRPIVIYCRSGKRSSNACQKLLAEESSLDITNLEGGIAAWEAAGLPVKRSGKHV